MGNKVSQGWSDGGVREGRTGEQRGAKTERGQGGQSEPGYIKGMLFCVAAALL